MNLSTFKNLLEKTVELQFVLPNQSLIAPHFHITEVGLLTKNFMDCGGTVREEKVINFQIWTADDFEHRLKPHKLLEIIALSQKLLGTEDLEIEVEFQSDTIGKYGLDFKNNYFLLTPKFTDCLAKDNCGLPQATHSETIHTTKPSCNPNLGCC